MFLAGRNFLHAESRQIRLPSILRSQQSVMQNWSGWSSREKSPESREGQEAKGVKDGTKAGRCLRGLSDPKFIRLARLNVSSLGKRAAETQAAALPRLPWLSARLALGVYFWHSFPTLGCSLSGCQPRDVHL